MSTKSNGTHSKTIKVNYLARVEGEGALYVKVRDDAVEEVKLKIFEPPRFFESFLRGRDFTEAPDITARICGICPIAYQMGASHAMEDACGVTVNGGIRDLRHLIYCGEWLESHALHVFMLHAPDFLGYQGAVEMAQDHPDIVKRGLELKKVGNEVMALLGGREVHPINPRVGGFYRAPTRRELDGLAERLAWGRDAALETLQFTATLDFPDFEQDYEFVALRHPDEYAILDGRLVSNRGLDVPLDEFLDHIYEEHVEHSTSLHAAMKARGPYMVGPMARYNLNFEQLTPLSQEAAHDVGLGPTCLNPYKSIMVRTVEMIHACDVALDLIDRYERPDPSYIEVTPRAGVGYGCTEAPRGICWHRYSIDDNGIILDARIIPPTSQNQKVMEQDLWHFVEKFMDLPEDDLQWKCEQGIRNYDPCISCSCHFLDLHLDRA
ncbi:MAG: Ni/Fe hydrogenase subunit alpha [Bacteroidetes bacterium]|jgi:coenzyme F420-reducing hydrogenase alpha subunit|nr:Ni/Fe hydrogenase subunit alpha [Bacteroidota bacterium]